MSGIITGLPIPYIKAMRPNYGYSAQITSNTAVVLSEVGITCFTGQSVAQRVVMSSLITLFHRVRFLDPLRSSLYTVAMPSVTYSYSHDARGLEPMDTLSRCDSTLL